MFCSKCENKLPNESIYCNKCGTEILDETIKKVYNDTDNLADQVHVKKKKQILVNTLLAFKNFKTNCKNNTSKNQREEKGMNILCICICIFVILVSIMSIIGFLNGMQLLQII